jgi:hypothetical protein
VVAKKIIKEPIEKYFVILNTLSTEYKLSPGHIYVDRFRLSSLFIFD